MSFSTKIFLVSLKETSVNKIKKTEKSFVLRRDIVDRNGDLISRNIQSYHAAVRSKLIKNDKKLLINLKLIFPDLDTKKIETNLKIKNNFI